MDPVARAWCDREELHQRRDRRKAARGPPGAQLLHRLREERSQSCAARVVRRTITWRTIQWRTIQWRSIKWCTSLKTSQRRLRGVDVRVELGALRPGQVLHPRHLQRRSHREQVRTRTCCTSIRNSKGWAARYILPNPVTKFQNSLL